MVRPGLLSFGGGLGGEDTGIRKTVVMGAAFAGRSSMALRRYARYALMLISRSTQGGKSGLRVPAQLW